MPGPYSSQGSIDDAAALARNLGIRFEMVPIGGMFEAYNQALGPVFAGQSGRRYRGEHYRLAFAVRC